MMQDNLPFGVKVAGKWHDILPELGISAKYLTGKHGPCPLCATGTNRFRFDNNDGWGTFYCNKCGSGDGIKLVMLKHRVGFKEAIEMIKPLLSTAKILPFKPKQTGHYQKQAMQGVWKLSKTITMMDPAGFYLNRRCGLLEYPSCLRYIEKLKYFDNPIRFFPTMVARVTDKDGISVNVHRTYLSTEKGAKAPVDDPKRVMSGPLPKGSAIRLYPIGDTLGISEGIESAISAHKLFGIPVWAAVNSTGLTNWIPPPEVKKVVIFGDNDESFAGHYAAYSLAFRIKNLEQLEVEVRIPQSTGWDWNKVHTEKLGI